MLLGYSIPYLKRHSKPITDYTKCVVQVLFHYNVTCKVDSAVVSLELRVPTVTFVKINTMDSHCLDAGMFVQ